MLNEKFQILFVTLISGIILFHRLSESPLSGDGAFYSEISKEMAKTGDYLTLRYGYRIDFHHGKPPIIFWMNAFSGKIFGFNNFAMRLPSTIMGFTGILILFFFVKRYFNGYTAFFSALILTFTQQWLSHSRDALTDIPFAIFFSLALFSFWRAEKENKTFFYYLTGFFVGLSVMTRNITGFLVYAIILPYIVFTKKFELFKKPYLYISILIAVAIALPWHLYMAIKYKSDFIVNYFGTLMRGLGLVKTAILSDPLETYIKKIVENYWPWLPFFVISLYRRIKEIGKVTGDAREKVIFLLLWCVIPFAIFHFPRFRRSNFIVPLYIPFAILTALVFNEFKATKIKIIKWFIGISSFLALMFLLFPIIPKALDSSEYKDTISLVPLAKQIDGDIITLHDYFWHYSNCLWFYADKRTIGNSKDEIIEKIKSKKKYFFILRKNDFVEITAKIAKPDILSVSENTVLFTTKNE